MYIVKEMVNNPHLLLTVVEARVQAKPGRLHPALSIPQLK